MPDQEILNGFVDKKGNFWLSTNIGLFNYNGKNFIRLSIENGLPTNSIKSFYEDKYGVYCIGSSQGLCKFEGSKFEIFTTAYGLPHDEVARTHVDQNNQVLISTEGGLFVKGKYKNEIFDSKNGLSKFGLHSSIIDNTNTIWVAQPFYGVSKHDGKSFKHLDLPKWEKLTGGYIFPRTIFQDSKSNIWISSDMGVAKYSEGNITYYDGFTTNDTVVDIENITEDKKGNIWFMHRSKLIKFDGNNFNVLNSKNGLPADFVYNIIQLNDTTYWIATQMD
ncbi:MAG: hypothetical protein SFY32_08810 [Bacteroidota bacterium]|nr:hypothetical protein [Bacteroidota bacterium]